MHKFLIGAASIAAMLVALGCSTFATSDPQTALSVAETGYAAYCAADKSASACSAANRKKAMDAEKLAQDAIDTNAGNAAQLVADVVKIIADLKK